MAYSWRFSGQYGGGFANCGSASPLIQNAFAMGGDVWGFYYTKNRGDLWLGAMGTVGNTSINTSVAADSIINGCAFSANPNTPGIIYVASGSGRRPGGYVGMVNINSAQPWKMNTQNASVNFGDTLGTSANPDPNYSNASLPRRTGVLMVCDYDAGTSTEYIYALTSTGLQRSTNQGQTWTTIKNSGGTTVIPTPPGGKWKNIVLIDSNTIWVTNYYTNFTGSNPTPANAGNTTYKITGIRGTATSSVLPGPPANGVADIRKVGNTIIAACTNDGIYTISSDGQTWTKRHGAFWTSSLICSSVDGNGTTFYASTTDANDGGKNVAKSTDSGVTWTWVTQGRNSIPFGFAANDTANDWWLNRGDNTQPLAFADANFDGQQLVCDPFDANHVMSFGRRGAWATRDGGNTWRPCIKGYNGGEVGYLAGPDGDNANPVGAVINSNNGDFKGASSTDHFRTCQTATKYDSTTYAYAARTLTRTRTVTIAGQTFTNAVYSLTRPSQSVPWQCTRTVSGSTVDISDDVLRGGMFDPSDLLVSNDGTVYITQVGGGVMVGDPNSTPPPSTPAITSSPPASTASTSASFAWTDSDVGVTFETQLDSNAIQTGQVSPKNYTTLPVGGHTFTLWARRTSDNVLSSPATFSWTITSINPPPSISNFSPNQGAVGTVITVNGLNFTGLNNVTIGGVQVPFALVSATQFTCTTQATTPSGQISITASGGSVTSAGSFTVLVTPGVAVLSANITASTATFTLAGDTTAFVAPMLLKCESELMFCSAFNAATRQCTVVRGFSGSATAGHNANTVVQYIDQTSGGVWPETQGQTGVYNGITGIFDIATLNRSVWEASGRTIASNQTLIQSAWLSAIDAMSNLVSTPGGFPCVVSMGQLFTDAYAGAAAIAQARGSQTVWMMTTNLQPGRIVNTTQQTAASAGGEPGNINDPTHYDIGGTRWPTYYEAFSPNPSVAIRTAAAVGAVIGFQTASQTVFDQFNSPYAGAAGAYRIIIEDALQAFDPIFIETSLGLAKSNDPAVSPSTDTSYQYLFGVAAPPVPGP